MKLPSVVRAHPRKAIGLVIVVVLTAVGLIALRDDPVTLEVVERGDGWTVSGLRKTSTVQTPNGSLELEIDLGKTASGPDSEIESPSNGRLVKVSWKREPYGGRRKPVWAGNHPTSLAVRVGGKTVGLTANAIGDGESPVVRIPGDGQDLDVVTTYAGREQSLHVTTGQRTLGAFGSLYRPDDVLPPEDSGTQDERPGELLRWGARWYNFGPLRVPYVAGLGWAPNGKEWVVLYESQLVSFGEAHYYRPADRAESTYRMRVVGASVTVNGRPAVRTIAPIADSARDLVYSPGTVAFAADHGAPLVLRLRAPMVLTREAGSTAGPAEARVAYDKTFRYDAVADLGGAA